MKFEQAGGGKDCPAVFMVQAIKRGESNAISAVKITQCIKEFGFELRVWCDGANVAPREIILRGSAFSAPPW